MEEQKADLMNLHEELADNTDSAVKQQLAEAIQAKEHDAAVAAQSIAQHMSKNKDMQEKMDEMTAEMAGAREAADAAHVQAMDDVKSQLSTAQQSVDSYKQAVQKMEVCKSGGWVLLFYYVFFSWVWRAWKLGEWLWV